MKVAAIKAYLEQELATLYDAREAQLIAEMTIEKVTNWSRMEQTLHREATLDLEQADKIYELLTILKKGVPVQQVLEEAWFYDLRLQITPDVLIPRPETEEMVLLVVETLKKHQPTAKVLDIGTGSGCIPLLVKHLLPACDVWAVDVSEQALAVAGANAQRLHLDIHFKQLDILNSSTWQALATDFDVIISNPPYIPLSEKSTLSEHVVAHEPSLALFVPDEQPLLFYEKIATFGQTHLREGGQVYLEIHADFGAGVKDLYVQGGYKEVRVLKDMQAKDRIVKACKK